MYKDPPHSDHDGRGSKDEAAGDKHEGAREVAEGGVVDEAVEGARDEGHEGAHQRQAGEHSPNLALVHTLAETDDVLSVPGRGLFSEYCENLLFSRTLLLPEQRSCQCIFRILERNQQTTYQLATNYKVFQNIRF